MATLFLITDSQIFQESLMEDIDLLLKHGDIPNLMDFEDIEDIN